MLTARKTTLSNCCSARAQIAQRLPVTRVVNPRTLHRTPVCRPCAVFKAPQTDLAKGNIETHQRKEEAGNPPSPVVTFLKNAAKGAAVLGVALALVLSSVSPAHAARSAGRAGGFSGPSASRSYGGGRSSYSGGYSGGIHSYAAPSLSYRAPIVVPSAPIIVPGPSMYYSPSVVAPVVSTGPSIADIAIISMFLVMAASAARSALSDGGEQGGLLSGGRPTLTRVQVGLLSLARELKHDLDHIAARADTSDSRGLHQLLQEVVLALLRHPRYCVYGDASQQSASSAAGLESAFNRASLQERSKFEQETLVNVGGRRRNSSYSRGSGASSKPDELIVVTLLVATGCKVDLPAKINSLADMQQALRVLGALPQDEVLGVELLWTPQAEGDFYTREEIAADYPNLRNL